MVGRGVGGRGRGRGAALVVALLSIGCGAAAHAVGAPTDMIDSGIVAHQPATRVDPPPRSFSVIAGGDVLTEERVRFNAARAGTLSGTRFDFGPMFAETAPLIEASDLAICHMETPIGAPGGAYGYAGRSPFGGNLLLAPYEIADGLRRVGFDRCSTASNHAFDLGVPGIASALTALHSSGISTVGTARSPSEAVDSVFEVNGVKVAHLAFTTSSNTVSPAEPWRLNRTRDPRRIVDAVAAARRSGAEVVLLSIHVSVELGAGPTPADRSLISSIVSVADVDAVFMHGPHVVQPFEMVNGTPVWWSLGNFVSEMGPPSVGRYASPRTSDGLLAFVRFTEHPDGHFTVVTDSVAICEDLADRTVRSATIGLTRTDLPSRVRSELSQCLARTRLAVPSTH